ncbi:MAG: helix-turn-helix domain-containing protein [Fimbriimonadales bacterium]
METADYRERRYLSAVEAAKFLGVSARTVHQLVSEGVLPAQIAASGQYRFNLNDLKQLRQTRQTHPTEEIDCAARGYRSSQPPAYRQVGRSG